MFDDDDEDITLDGVALLEELRSSGRAYARPIERARPIDQAQPVEDDDRTIDGSVLTVQRWTPPPSVATNTAVRVRSGKARLRGSASVLIAGAIGLGVLIVGLALFVVRPADQPEPSIVDTTSVGEAGQ